MRTVWTARSVVLAACLPAGLLLALPSCNIALGPDHVEATSPYVESAPGSAEHALPAFAHVLVEGPLDVEVRLGDPPSVRFEGDTERLPELSAELKGETLCLYSASGTPWRVGPFAVVTVPSLTSLTAVGSGWVIVTGLDQAEFDVRLRGSGDVLLRGQVGDLRMVDEGAGRIDVSAIVPR